MNLLSLVEVLIVAVACWFVWDGYHANVPTDKPRTSDYRHTRDRTKRSEMRSAPR